MLAPSKLVLLACAVAGTLTLAGCGTLGSGRILMSERECMARAMYFESNRSSRDGMLAVGTVVMNRKGTAGYPSTVCGVVGQKNQFAPGVLTKPMKETRSAALAHEVAEDVLRGRRHHGVRKAKHFHTAGLRFPYKNMHYVLIAGGNEFYERH